MIEYEDEIRDEIIAYFGNCETKFNDSAKEIVNSYQSEWDSLPYDDGGSLEQDKALDDLVNEVLQELLDSGDIWVNNYRFDYINKTENYSEYDGFIENAPDEETAWRLFLGYSGEFGIADDSEYLCVSVGDEL